MNKKALCKAVVASLKRDGIKKEMSLEAKNKIYISDDYGNRRVIRFDIPENGIDRIYTYKDVENIINMALQIIGESLSYGEPIEFRGLFKLGFKIRKGRTVKNVLDGQECHLEARYVPDFSAGNILKQIAYQYGVPHLGEQSENDTVDDEIEFAKYFFQLTGEKIEWSDD